MAEPTIAAGHKPPYWHSSLKLTTDECIPCRMTILCCFTEKNCLLSFFHTRQHICKACYMLLPVCLTDCLFYLSVTWVDQSKIVVRIMQFHTTVAPNNGRKWNEICSKVLYY